MLALAASRPAAGADLVPVQKAPPVTVQTFSWSGFYAGLNVGYGVGRSDNSEDLVAGVNNSHQRFTVGPAGWLAGAQAGYNWLLSPNWVVGIEGDWQWTRQRDSVCISACSTAAFGTATTLALTVEQQLSWLATLRGRIGYSAGPSLWYVTGGGAWGHVKTSSVFNILGTLFPASAEHTKSGWTVGGGVERVFSPGWTAKLEYPYVDLGSVTDTFVYSALGGSQTFSYRITEHVIRLGVNRQFGSGGSLAAGSFAAAPIRATIPVNWNGFYAGLNVGYGVARNRSTESSGPPAGQTNEQFTLSPNGLVAGGQAGYNWQPSASWMIGAEADWQWSNQHDAACIAVCTTNLSGTGVAVSFRPEQKIHWLTTVRARVGVVQNDWLWYATGGPAWGRTTETLIFQAGGGQVSGNFSHIKSGFAVGGGTESRIAGNWTAKLEYLYVDLGTVTDVLPLPLGVVQTVDIKVQDHIFRAGLNYQFAPIVGARL
jgi:outer membrane immunogenic protein